MSSLWHHTLPPTAQSTNPSNALPRPLNRLTHPTHAVLSSPNETLAWESRHHRKHRHVPFSPSPSLSQPGRPRRNNSPLQGFLHMTRLEWWNISWWVAIAFTLGSIVWTLNGFGSFLPFILPSRYTTDANASFNGWTAFTGATIFELGSLFGLWEAWNREDEVFFGWGIKHSVKHAFSRSHKRVKYSDKELALSKDEPPEKHWTWFSHHPKYLREIGFLAALSQFLGASIFWISGFTAIPQIQTALQPHTALLDIFFWTPQVVGGSGFVISSILLMLESQKTWYKLTPLSLGWQIGFWNLIGGIGFTLCGALGYAGDDNSKTQYQSTLATFWGSWAFLIGSVVQWYESVNSV